MPNVIVEEELREVELEAIKDNPHQPRKEFSLEELEELAASIQQIGLIHPPIVRETLENTYMLIAGERRLRALKILGRTKTLVIVRNIDENVSAESSLVENLQRVDLNPLEIATALQRLAERFTLTQEELADRVGKKRPTVANYLRLLQLPREVQLEIAQGALTMGHAKATLSLPKDQQLQFAKAIIANGWSVRAAERQAQNWLSNNPQTRKPKFDSILYDLKTRLEHRFNTAVNITSRQGKGHVTFQYSSLDDLDRMLHLWGVGEI